MSHNNWEIVSYLTLRRLVGMIGVLLPIVLALGCWVLCDEPGLKRSISAYYGTEMRDVFVGGLFAVGFFMLTYRGYEPQDDRAGDLAFVCALGTALLPTTSESSLVSGLHLFFAAVLLLTFAYYSLFLFTKGKRPFTEQKETRNKAYIGSGIVILASLLAILIYKLFLEDSALAGLQPVFWLEALALWAFGFSWFVKGKTLWADPASQ